MNSIDELIIALVKDRKVKEACEVFMHDSDKLLGLIQSVTSTTTYPIPEYGSWILFHIQRKSPTTLLLYQENLVDYFLHCTNPSVLKNIASILSQLPTNDYRSGDYLDLLFHYFQDPNSKPALKVNCLYCLFPFIKQFPEIKSEVDLIFQQLKTQEFSPALNTAERKYKKLF